MHQEAQRPSDSQLLSALFAGAPIGLAFWDAQLRYRRVSEQLAVMNGLSAQEHLGRGVTEVLPELGPQLEGVLGEVLTTARPKLDMHISGETPASPGIERHWLASYFPVLNDDGEATGVGATVVEITAEREAAARARRAERVSSDMDAHLRATYAALPVGVAFVTTDLRYERVNDALARMNGLPVEAYLGHTIAEVLGEHAGQAEEVAREVMRRRMPIQAELAIPVPASPGGERHFEATYFPVFASGDEGGGDGLLGVGAVVRDVTEHHVQEREREELLRDAVTARAQAEAAQVRTEAARKEAEAARHEVELTLVQAEEQRAAAETANQRARFLARITRRLAASLDYESTVREVVSSAIPYLADWGFITVLEPTGRRRVLGASHVDPERMSAVAKFAEDYASEPDSSVNVAIDEGETVLLRDVDAEALPGLRADREMLDRAIELGVRHVATWPIRAADETVIGALSFVNGDSGRTFTEGDLQVMDAVASRAGLHLTNAQLYSERAEIADTLQASLLPAELPSIPGLDLAAAFVAAGRHNVVGGDFYDVFWSGDGAWTAIIGDVAGKGAKAAAVTAAARHTLRAAALLDQSPTHNLALLNRVLRPGSGERGEFCSVVYVRLCPHPTGLVACVAHAGHPPALILRADGRVEQVTGGRGPLAGVYTDASFEETEISLSFQDVLLLYTDGVTEARPDDLALVERELASTLESAHGKAASDVADAVRDCALRLQVGAPRDDIAVLAIRVIPRST